MDAPDVGMVACPNCGKHYKIKGLASHRRKCDKVSLNNEIVITKTKPHWSAEESFFLARSEADALLRGVRPVKINSVLYQLHPNRSEEAVKGQRRKKEHKELVIKLVQEGHDKSNATDYSDSAEAEEVESAAGCGGEEISGLRALPDDSNPLGGSAEEGPFEGKRRLEEWLRNSIKSGTSREEKGLNHVILLALRGEPFATDLDRVLAGYEHVPTDRNEPGPGERLSNRQARRKEYREIQNLYEKNRKVCAQRILDGPKEAGLEAGGLLDFWYNIMSSDDSEDSAADCSRHLPDTTVTPLTEAEVKDALPTHSSAPGPDGLTVKEIKSLPLSFLTKLFNLFLYWERAPVKLVVARTIFIPKGECSSDPADFRPITIGSLFLRVFHKVLERRLRQIIVLRTEQRAFCATDGCFENIHLLSSLLKTAHSMGRSLFLANIDLRKAFDSATHRSIINALAKHNQVGSTVVNYLKWFYKNSTTNLTHGSASRAVRPRRGVRQGDPLSPLLFNLVIDEFLSEIPEEFGVKLGERKCAALAFADDLVLIAETERGLQYLLDSFGVFLEERGFEINFSKSSTLSLIGDGKNKRAKIVPMCFSAQGNALPTLGVSDTWAYLGVIFDTDGNVNCSDVDLAKLLHNLGKAPLKPQQKLNILTFYLIPRLIYQLVVCARSRVFLRKIDRKIRAAVRDFLHLPLDTPIAFFYATVDDGGLGVHCMETMIPRVRYSRLLAVEAKEDCMLENLVASRAWVEMVEKARKAMQFNGIFLETKIQVRDYWRNALLKMVDGRGLREARLAVRATWVRDPPRYLSGREYVDLIKLRIHALPTKSRCARGRAKDLRCRAGCVVNETHTHVIQICPRTYSARLKRHNEVVAWFRRKAERESFISAEEPRVKVGDEILKPDLVLVKDRRALVVDAQVVGEYKPLNSLDADKIRKYSKPAFIDKVKETFEVSRVDVYAITTSERGIVSSNSANFLNSVGVSKREVAYLGQLVARGTLKCFYHFMRGTQRGF